MNKFSEEQLKQFEEIVSHYPEGKQKSALLPVLHLAQDCFGGWLSEETMNYVAELLSITPIEVYEVATFYTMFNLHPVAKFTFELCHTGPCMLKGSDDVLQYISEKLGIKPGEMTMDGLFSLKTVECLGACGYAPVVQMGDRNHEHLTKEKVDEIIDNIKNRHIN